MHPFCRSFHLLFSGIFLSIFLFLQYFFVSYCFFRHLKFIDLIYCVLRFFGRIFFYSNASPIWRRKSDGKWPRRRRTPPRTKKVGRKGRISDLIGVSVALQALQRKKRYEKQLQQVDGALTTLETQRDVLENANTNTLALDSMQRASKALKAVHKDM